MQLLLCASLLALKLSNRLHVFCADTDTGTLELSGNNNPRKSPFEGKWERAKILLIKYCKLFTNITSENPPHPHRDDGGCVGQCGK